MFYIICAILLFIFSVTAHIFFCRKTAAPGLHAKAFVFMAIIFLGIYVTIVLSLQCGGMLDPHSLWGIPFKITAGIIFILLVPIYLCFYVLTQLMSPSQKILMAISCREGLSYTDIVHSVQKEDFINTRLSDLEKSGCVRKVEGRYVLSLSGRTIAGILDMMQGILGRDMGG